ncbi:helix-turn-helix domain-containing protein [Amycolatopsis sp. NPDC059021]|uniref:helix-turn-helix domain-containing protein n=1 Tax=Amycolatopsis sp. NPDC059021 TaxID=3346704 RepID=UPI00366F4DD1
MVRDPLIPRLVSVTEAAEIVGCSRQNINTLVNDGRLPAERAGTTFVLAEDTVRRYAAGERFGFPTLLVVHTYDEEADSWVEAARRSVAPDYKVPERFGREMFDEVAGGAYRVELLDNNGKTIAVRTAEAEVTG